MVGLNSGLSLNLSLYEEERIKEGSDKA